MVLGVHDVADGGLGLALAEMAVRSGVGVVVDADVDGPTSARSSARPRAGSSLSVDPARVDDVLERSSTPRACPCAVIGRGRRATGSSVDGLLDLGLAELTTAWRDALPGALGHGTAQ